MRHSINNVQIPLQKYLDMNVAHNKNLLALATQNQNYPNPNTFSSGKFSIHNVVNPRSGGIQMSNVLNTNPMSQSNKSSNNGFSKPIDLQLNPTFNGSQYFQKEANSKPNLSSA